MLQTRFELSNKPTRTGGLAIMLVIYIGGKRKRLSTHIEVNTKSNFNYKAKKGHWVTGMPESKSLNQGLSDFMAEAEAKYKALDEGASAESVKLALKDKDKSDSFIQYAHDYLQTYYDRGQLSYWKAVRKSLNKFEDFAKSKNYSDVSFNDLSPRMIEDFKTFLIKQRNSRHPEMTLKASFTAPIVCFTSSGRFPGFDFKHERIWYAVYLSPYCREMSSASSSSSSSSRMV